MLLRLYTRAVQHKGNAGRAESVQTLASAPIHRATAANTRSYIYICAATLRKRKPIGARRGPSKARVARSGCGLLQGCCCYTLHTVHYT
uniref:Uncharacterized protein n=1 Tax=Trichogramma kaykai TaxID=54128 RepID=A0ABD2X468_9HYME